MVVQPFGQVNEESLCPAPALVLGLLVPYMHRPVHFLPLWPMTTTGKSGTVRFSRLLRLTQILVPKQRASLSVPISGLATGQKAPSSNPALPN